MSKRRSDKAPKSCTSFPPVPPIEKLRADNENTWSQIEQLHKSTNSSPNDEVSLHDDESLTAHPLEIALEAEIELLANTPFPSVLETLSEAVALHGTLVSQELDESLASLIQTEAVLDRVIIRIRQNLNEMEQFMDEHEQICKSLHSRAFENRKDDKKGRLNGDDALKRAREEKQWLCDAMESFSTLIAEQYKQRSTPDEESANEWAYLSSSKRDKQLYSATTTGVGGITQAMGPLTSKKRKRYPSPVDNQIDPALTSSEVRSSDTPQSKERKCTSGISLYRLLDDLIRRLISNPDDPFIVLNMDEEGSSTKNMIHMLIQSGVIERHPDDSNLIQLVDLR